MWLYNLYIPSLHDELAHPRIWIGMPTLTYLGWHGSFGNVGMLMQILYWNIVIPTLVLHNLDQS